MKHKIKLIERIIPIEAINANAEYEKKPGVGPHPRSLHLWWAKRPHAAARAIIFCQLVDDPSSSPELFPTIDDQNKERERLMEIAAKLSDWKLSFDDDVMKDAQKEILKSNNGEFPIISDPFSGGGTIAAEAQRIGVPSVCSDINPIPFLIGKTMVEYPWRYKDSSPRSVKSIQRTSYRFSDGLASDFRNYGNILIEKFKSRMAAFYPRVDLPKEFGSGKADVVCWLWAKTVASPDPALSGLHVPLIKSMDLCNKKGSRVWLQPKVSGTSYTFGVQSEALGHEYESIKGTVGRSGATCIVSGAAIPLAYIRKEGVSGRIGEKLIAIAVNTGGRGKVYIPATESQSELMFSCKNLRDGDLSIGIEHWSGCTNSVVYGFDTFDKLFNDRQSYSLKELASLISEMRSYIRNDILDSGCSKEFSEEYSIVMVDYLSLALSRALDFNNRFTGWNASNQKIMHLFGSHRIPMVWDYGEANITSNVVGGLPQIVEFLAKCIERVQPRARGSVTLAPAQEISFGEMTVVSTDPPYFDNVPYSNLSDFFYMWLRPIMKESHSSEFGTIATPKNGELVANEARHGSKAHAEEFFLNGMEGALTNLKRQHDSRYPIVIYYAFKQSEIEEEGLISRGWSAFLSSVVASGLQVIATWPIRSESSLRLRAHGSNALSTSVVMVCRVRENVGEVISRSDFVRNLRKELPSAIATLQASNVSPADMPQSAIGPGIRVFSRYAAVLESDDSPMSVKTALQLINAELDTFLSSLTGDFDAETRFAVTWFEQFGYDKGEFGTAQSLCQARGLAVDAVKHAGIIESAAGKVRLLKRSELDDGWDPNTDTHLTIWECLQYLVRALDEGEENAARLLKRIGPERAGAVKDLAYYLYDLAGNKRRDAQEATAYNALIALWSDLTGLASTVSDDADRQASLF